MMWFRGSARETAASSPFDVFCDASATEEAHEGAYAAIKAGLGRVTDLLEPASLGESLRSDDAKIRSRAVLCVANLLEEPGDDLAVKMTALERKCLAEFVGSRCTDPSSTTACLRVLTSLLVVDDPEVIVVASKVILGGELHVPAHAQKARQRAWELMHVLLPRVEAPVVYAALRGNLELDDDEAAPTDADLLARGLAAALAGEKDPRCLLRALRCAAKLGGLIKASASASVLLFEAVAPYFPISFAPPEHDPYNISPEMLRLALREALCGNSAMAASALELCAEYIDKGDEEDERDESCALMACAVTTVGDLLKKLAPKMAQVLANDIIDAKRGNLDATLEAVGAVSARCAESREAWTAFYERSLLPALSEALSDAQLESVAGRRASQAIVTVASQGAFCWTSVVGSNETKGLCEIARSCEITGRRRAALETLASLAASVTSHEVVEPAVFSELRQVTLEACEDSTTATMGARAMAVFAGREASASASDSMIETALAAICRSPTSLDDTTAENVALTAACRPEVALRVAKSTTRLEALAALAADETNVAPLFLEKCIEALRQKNKTALTALTWALRRSSKEQSSRLGSMVLEHNELVAALADADADVVVHAAALGASPEARAACVRALAPLRPVRSALGALLCALDRSDVANLEPLTRQLIDAYSPEEALRVSLEALLCRTPKAAAIPLIAALHSLDPLAAARVVIVRGDDAASYESVTSLLAKESSLRGVLASSEFGAREPTRSFASRFWRQRLYSRLAPKLLAAADARAVCSLALAAPRASRESDAAILLETAITSLETKSTESATDAAALMELLLSEESAPLMEKLTTTLLPRALAALLDAAQTTSDDDPEARRDALRAIGCLASRLPHSALYPHRKQVAKGLRAALDDDLRAIRHLAAKVRNDWLIKVGGSIT